MTEDEMVGWHHWLNGRKFEQAPGDGEGQSSLACCSSKALILWHSAFFTVQLSHPHMTTMEKS